MPELLQTLAADHTGHANGINARELAAKLGTDTRALRALISDARSSGTAIAGTPSTGYYIAVTAEELQQCCKFLRNRAMHSLRIEAQLRRIPLAQLLSQLQPT